MAVVKWIEKEEKEDELKEGNGNSSFAITLGKDSLLCEEQVFFIPALSSVPQSRDNDSDKINSENQTDCHVKKILFFFHNIHVIFLSFRY